MKFSLTQEGKNGTIVIIARPDDAKPDSYPIIVALLPPDQLMTAEAIKDFLVENDRVGNQVVASTTHS